MSSPRCARTRRWRSPIRSSTAASSKPFGFKRSSVFPIVLDPDRYAMRPIAQLGAPYRDGHVNFLHVGRLVPNKRIEDILKVFYFYRRRINPDSRLFLVGIDTDMEIYAVALRQLIHDLGLSGIALVGRPRSGSW